MNEIQQKVPVVSWNGLEERIESLRTDWLEAVAKWESYKRDAQGRLPPTERSTTQWNAV